MTKLAVVGLGKMGLSHVSMIRPHPDVELVGVCDSTGYLLDVLGKYTGVATFGDFDRMLSALPLDGVIIATPTHMHESMVRNALERGLHVFCEKPFVLDPGEGQALAALAEDKGLVTQVGYHNRFVGSFGEVKRLLDRSAIGDVVGGLAEAYGPVVLKPEGRTWRSSLSAGGGALYDYAAHPVDLLTWYLGEPAAATGTVASIFSREIDDLVAATLHFPSAVVQLNVNWSDESQRKMTTKISLWGTAGTLYADRQELRVHFGEGAQLPVGYDRGWNVRYTTDLTPAPYFYVRGEEYSLQLDAFVRRIRSGEVRGQNDFMSALTTDRVLAAIRASDAVGVPILDGTATIASGRPQDEDALDRIAATAVRGLRRVGDVAGRASRRAAARMKGWRR